MQDEKVAGPGSGRRRVRGSALSLVAGLAVALSVACGNESVVSGGVPDLAPTVTETTQPPEENDSDVDDSASTTTATTTPEPAEPQEDTADEPQLSEHEANFVAELRAAGAEPFGQGEHAVATAEYVCAALADGVAREDILINVTAMVGLEMQLNGAAGTVDDMAATYVDVAEQQYCG
ncbi:DUF732 domain-containing protein [Hoyosella sp. YIM 151337]|uniref:DUF732 domain-containing protein n=1 Tax=Hoyosella sp. YIM 151337 TaxID=2992742 RepID=UPI00223692DE|nr:DUF732 domain-containing protein [Hoyosella sp. YIM 151337]MCW4354623.1 DUF732 domain-containing protein [Hoyosella sp. YIM 151337]